MQIQQAPVAPQISVLYLFGAFHQIGDRNGELTARMNVEQLMEALGVSESDLSPSSSEFEMQGDASLGVTFYI